jgi:hypothetical protein
LFRSIALEEAARFAATVNKAGLNVYVGTTLKSAAALSGRRTSARDAVLATCIAIDIDTNLVTSARNLPVKPHLLVVTGSIPAPRGHVWIGIKPTDHLDLWEDITTRAVAHCGGDMAARGKSRVMRLGGSVSYPSERKQQRGYEVQPVIVHSFDRPIYDIADLQRVFPPLPAPPISRAVAGSRLHHRAAPFRVDAGCVENALAALPVSYANDHDLWVRVGFALHSFDCGTGGLDLWKAFSGRCPAKAALTNFEQRWASFGRASGRRISIRWLLNEARRHGWSNHVSRRRSRIG